MAEWTGVKGKRVLITGATRGIGLAAAEQLGKLGASLTLVARDSERGDRARRRVVAKARGEIEVDVLEADLSLQRSVRALADEALRRYERIDVLVNNAGAINRTRKLTDEGFELTWAVNHLAPFLLTNLLLERLKASAPARVITTSSDAHKGALIPFEDPHAQRRYRMQGYERYGQTKLANILFTKELAKRLRGTGVTANCFHPGLVATGFNRNNGLFMKAVMLALLPTSRRPARGADTLVWLANSAEVSEISGEYFVDRRIAMPSAPAQDAEFARLLWQLSEEQSGLSSGAAAARSGS